MEARNFHEAFRMLTSEWKAKSKVIAFDALPGRHGGETSALVPIRPERVELQHRTGPRFFVCQSF